MAGVITLCLNLSAFASDPTRMVSQYVYTKWGLEKGFPGGSIFSIAQSSDGYLWIGTDRGLIRFDGLNFQNFKQATPGTFPIGAVKSLLADERGNLWVLLQSTKLLRYHDGNFELSRGGAENGITAMCQSTSGAVLVSSLAKGTLAYNGEQFEAVSKGPVFADPVARANGVPPDEKSTHLSWSTGVTSHLLAAPTSAVTSMAATADGKIWLATEDRGLFSQTAKGPSAIPNGLLHGTITSLLPLQGEELWIGTSKGVVRWNGNEFTRDGVPPAIQHVEVLSLIRDIDSNIWVGTAHGLLRYNANGGSSASEASAANTPVNALFEDRERNLWIGGPQMIERLRDSAFVTYSIADGLPSERNGPVYVDSEGRTWFAPLDGGLHWMKGQQGGSVTDAGLAQDVVYSISGREGELWVGRQHGGLTSIRTSGGSFITKTYTEADGLAQNSVYAVYQSRDGTVWAGTLGNGVSAFREGRFVTYTTGDGLPSNMITSITESPDGTIWIATANGLSSFSKGRWHVFTQKDGLPSVAVNCLLADSSGVLWLGTNAGIAFLNAGHVQVPRELPEQLREPIFGIAEDRRGRLWIATSNHVLRMIRNELLRSVFSDADMRAYGVSDGLLGTEGVKRDTSVVADPLGKIWFSLNRGLSVVDPNRETDDSAAALVHIETVTVDGNSMDPKTPLQISSARQRIAFDYIGLSLSDSERVRYRYRLDGFDRDWSAPTSIRSAIYTNLSPGSYRFRVIASNSDGLWSGGGASLDFAIKPALYQTNWFRALCVAAFLALAWAFYQLRVRQLQREERKLREVVETIPTFAWTALPDGAVDFVNRHWKEYTGLSSEKTAGTGWEAVLHPADRKRYLEKWRLSLATGEPFENEVRYRRATDGQYRWFWTRAVPLREGGKVLKWYGISTDIEDRKSAEQDREMLRADLAHVNRVSLLGELTASLSHELRQPIAATITNAYASLQWLDRAQPDIDEARQAAERIMRDGAHASEIIDRLRSLYKKCPPNRELVDTNEIIKEMVLLLRGEANRYSVSMRMELSTYIPKIAADRVQMQQVLMNLMINAIEAMKETGGALTLKSQLDQDGRLRVSVSDTGVGLPAEEVDEIFNAFFTTKSQGSGMGLAISRSILESHGGRVWATPNNGRGATVSFTLPITADVAQEGAVVKKDS